jgi:ketosteroid isomerase-like protein
MHEKRSSSHGESTVSSIQRMRTAAQMQALIPVDYVVEFEEITVTGGSYRGTARPRAGGSDMNYSGKLMRILQRQPDGTWKMHRTMMTSDPQSR